MPAETSLGGSDDARFEPAPRGLEPQQGSKEWHARDPGWVAAKLESSTCVGLDEAEAARRLCVHGANELEVGPRVSPWRLLLEQFENVLILILLPAPLSRRSSATRRRRS